MRLGFYRLLVLPAALLLCGAYLVPLAGVLLLSVTEPAPGLDNYVRVFTGAGVRRTLLTTALMGAGTTALALLGGYVVAYVLTQAGPRARRLMLGCVLLPLWVSVLARAFAWFTLLRREGVVNTALMDWGVIARPLPLMWNSFGVAVGTVHYLLPFAVLAMAAQMRGIDRSLLLAARGMGAGQGQAFRRVFLPLSLPGVAGAAVLVLIFSLGFYVTPVLLGGGRVLEVAEYISVQVHEVLDWGMGAALATVLVAAVAAVLAASRALGLRAVPGLR